MPIHIVCQCGKSYMFKDEFAGRRARCPTCNREMLIPAHAAAEVEDVNEVEAAPEKSSKGVLIFAICATGAVVLLAAGLLIAYYTGDHSVKPPAAPPPPTTTVSLPSVRPPPDKDPLLAPPPGKVAAPTPTPAKKAGGAAEPPPLPPMAPAEILLPFRNEGTNYYFLAPSATAEESKKQHESFRAAHISTIGMWLDWLGAAPDRAPATAILRKPFPKDRVLTTYGNRTPAEERDTIDFEESKVKRSLRVTWLQYQDVGFAVDELNTVVAIRVSAWPAKPAAPAAGP